MLDPTTILLMATLMAVAMSVVLYSAHLNFPREIKGLRDWALGLVFMVAGVVIFAAHGTSNIMLLSSNVVIAWGLGLMMIGTERFYELRPSWRLFHCVWLLAIAGLGYWLWIKPSFTTRVAIASFLVLIFHFRGVFVVWRNGENNFSTWFFGSLMLIQSCMVITRGTLALTTGIDVNLMGTGLFASLYLATGHFMTLLMTVGFMTVCTRRLQTTLEQRSMRDPLTQVLNRRGFAEIYIKEHAVMRRAGTYMTMLNIDVDYFKKINDSHGHAVGDRVLVDISQMIAKALRVSDHVARFGGEEFVVLLPATGLDGALQIADRIRAALRVPRADVPAYTVSIGVACQLSAEESLDGFLIRADKAMYRAKERGRDRVEIEPDPAMPLRA